MSEDSKDTHEQEWLKREKKRIPNASTHIFPQKAPTAEETAMRQLKNDALQEHLKDKTYVPETFTPKEEVGPEAIKRIIEKVEKI